MTKTPILRTVVGGSMLLLAACGEKSATNAPPPTNESTTNAMSAGDNMPGMEMPTKAATASGHGTVKAIDAAAGKITLDHGPIPAAGWPAMTMTFDASPAVLQSAKVGDAVDFDVAPRAGSGEVTAIHKR